MSSAATVSCRIRDSAKAMSSGMVLSKWWQTIALLASQIVTLARMGKYSVAVLMEQGRNMLGTRQVIPGVEAVVDEVQVQTI
jgi:urease gamma subunit